MVRRTWMYRQSLLLPSSVRAPHTTGPRPTKSRMTLTDLPSIGLLSGPCRSALIFTLGSITDFSVILAGAFHTPRFASLLVYTPAMAPLGGSKLIFAAMVS